VKSKDQILLEGAYKQINENWRKDHPLIPANIYRRKTVEVYRCVEDIKQFTSLRKNDLIYVAMDNDHATTTKHTFCLYMVCLKPEWSYPLPTLSWTDAVLFTGYPPRENILYNNIVRVDVSDPATHYVLRVNSKQEIYWYDDQILSSQGQKCLKAAVKEIEEKTIKQSYSNSLNSSGLRDLYDF
jgi:hypothetical protein